MYPGAESHNGGVLSTAPCDPTWIIMEFAISEATLNPRNCFKEARDLLA